MERSRTFFIIEEWKKNLNRTMIMKEDTNKLAMNFLVTNGYQEAAEDFLKESGTKLEVDLWSFGDQASVLKIVQCGNIEYAIERLNSLNPEILNANPKLFFRLQQQILIELILDEKKGTEAMEFTTGKLYPLVLENEEFMQELKYTLTILSSANVSTNPSKKLRVIKQRFKLASEVNAAILTSQGREKVEVDLASFTEQAAIIKAVQCGNIEDAIERLNGLNPQILNANPELFFRLQQQILIELILDEKEEAFKFTEEKIHPLVLENEEFMQELKNTLTQIRDEDVSTYASKELIDITHRFKLASEVNAAILTSQGREKDAKLERLLKMLVWTQNQLDKIAVYPRINLSNAKFEGLNCFFDF